ncbi:hypothetical protein ABIE21_000286 [Conyzicola nivalis]|uniref:Uncharacterized protein n=1 Tax=Conyzicola nivalis TaxID=1477021 RepID=A0ABV2QIC2_9MICO
MASFIGVHDSLQYLSLSESDFSAGNEVVDRIAAFKRSIDELDVPGEPWVDEWLAAEHYKSAVLYAAAKVNWNHEQNGRGSNADRLMRARIIVRFNEWGEQAQRRLNEYESSSRHSSVVLSWRGELERFRDDPVQNP